MAENIGKIVVSIEAEVAALREGLARAEAEFKKSADKLAAEQSKLSTKFKKSWTELASKISVVSTVLNVAEKSMKGLTDAMNVWGEEGSSASEKVGGSIMAFGDAGIPVISGVINTAEALAGMFIDVAGAIQEANDALQANAKISKEYAKAMRGEEIIAGMNKQLEIQKQLADIATLEVRPEGNEFEIFHAKRAMQRFKLEERLQQQIGEMREGAQKENAERAARETLRFFDNESTQKIQKLGMFLETQASKEREAREEKSRLDAEALKKEEQAKIDAAKKVADKTLDLQTQLNIMLAEQAGDEEKARTLAIEARYKKMSEGATAAQQKIIQQMKEIELAGITPTAGAGGGGGTTTVSTAVGSFTVASGAIETKKQTSLLKRIANATEKMGDQSTGVSVILAA